MSSYDLSFSLSPLAEVGPPGPIDNTTLLQAVEGKTGVSLSQGKSLRRVQSEA